MAASISGFLGLPLFTFVVTGVKYSVRRESALPARRTLRTVKEAVMADSLVVGVDGATEALATLDVAVALTHEAAAPLFVVHVEHVPFATFPDTTGIAQGAMAEALKQHTETIRAEVSRHLADADTEWSFEVTSGAHDAAAIVVGGKTHNALGGLVLGSVGENLVRYSPVSVVVARDGKASTFAAASPDDRVHASTRCVTGRQDAVA
jgi:nucleotide-binding universal stress UspA family protein